MQTEKDIVRFLIAALVVAAIYDLFVLNQGSAVVQVVPSIFKGIGGIFARVTGGTAPAGY
jgi:hypothetical protein